MNFSESYEQRRVVGWLEFLGVPPDAFTAIPHGGKRDVKTAAVLKLEGVRPGAPDILFYSNPPIALEMKRVKNGRVSKEQEAVHARCRAAGWTVIVAKGAEEAKSALLKLPHFLGLFKHPRL